MCLCSTHANETHCSQCRALDALTRAGQVTTRGDRNALLEASLAAVTEASVRWSLTACISALEELCTG